MIEQGKWIIRPNQEMRELYKYLDIVVHIKKERLEHIGYVVILNEGRRV